MDTDGSCPACAHPWSLHPVALLTLFACAECVSQEDRGERETICTLVPPTLAALSASHFMSTSSARTRLGLWRIYLSDRDGRTLHWATQYLGWTTRERVRTAENAIKTKLETSPVVAFREWLLRR